MLRLISELNHPRIWSFPSIIKSVGNHLSRIFFPSSGKGSEAQGAAPESSQTSRTSGTRFISDLHFSHFKTTLSIHGLCSSFTLTPSSSREPISFVCLHFWQTQIGSGIPQYLCLEMHQSCKFSSQLWNHLSPAQSGVHLIFLFSEIILLRNLVTPIYHWSVTR